ncbi:phosphoglycerate kinase [Candidatus Pacearchaeota archaeon]|nr:phosphoglycerate kinase [Candidatus Pacearchaeota archaeon]
MNFDDVAKLQETKINPNSKWIYAADFNIKHKNSKLKNTDRVDVEIEDLKYILDQGGNPIILAHKGRFKKGDTEDLDFIVPYLSSKLESKVEYFPENSTYEAVQFVQGLKPGTVAIMGNTRKNEGEEKDDPFLAAEFARLGQNVAVGGFGKAHRIHASNVGILRYLPGYATKSQLKEMKLLEPWAGKDPESYSVAILGGIKKEKILTGLAGFLETYDAIIPGGIVLNTILHVQGFPIGKSLIKDSGKTYEKQVAEALRGENKHKIHIPEKVVIAKKQDDKYLNPHTINPKNTQIPKDYMIVDFILPNTAIQSLDQMIQERGRGILAGTPGIYNKGFKQATDPVLASMRKNLENCAVLGGDTAAEVNYEGVSSTGGGSALYFIVNATTPVFEALKTNKRKLHK